jgi:hypothetical protein
MGEPEELKRPTVNLLQANSDEEVQAGRIPACDCCQEDQLFGCCATVVISYSQYNLCTACFEELAAESDAASTARKHA